jgi:hypothetical protein
MSERNRKEVARVLAGAGMLVAVIFTAGLTGAAAWIFLPFGALPRLAIFLAVNLVAFYLAMTVVRQTEPTRRS